MSSFKKWASAIMGSNTCQACGCTPCMCPVGGTTSGLTTTSSNSALLQHYGNLANQYSQYMSGAISSSVGRSSYTPPTKAELYKGQCRTALKAELTEEEFSKVTLTGYEKYVDLASEALGEFLSDSVNAVRGWQTFRKMVEEMRASVAQGEPTAALDAEVTFYKLSKKDEG